MSGVLRAGLERHGLLADKRLGQHFLLDLNVTRKIAGLLDPSDAPVVEIGPGPGGLTRALLETRARRVFAVEKDARFLPLLRELATEGSDRLVLLHADALGLDLEDLVKPQTLEETRIVANLPYNVGTPLLVSWLKASPPPCEMVLMFQKEVAERIVAKPDTAAYGRLTVLCQTVCEARLALRIPARAFVPPPRVDSAVVVLRAKKAARSARWLRTLERVSAAAFGQRRKMLRSSLRALGGEALCEAAGVSPQARAEAVDLAGFADLVDVLERPQAAPDQGSAEPDR